MRGAQSPAQFFSDHGRTLLAMAFIALIARPAVSTAHELIKNQMIAAPVANRVRWLTHRYVLRQSLGFFQNDFAGRVANKVIQTGPALRESVVQVIRTGNRRRNIAARHTLDLRRRCARRPAIRHREPRDWPER